MKAELKVYFTVEHLFWDTSIKETPAFTKFGPGKMFTQSLYLLPLPKEQHYPRKRDIFFGSRNPVLTSIQGTP